MFELLQADFVVPTVPVNFDFVLARQPTDPHEEEAFGNTDKIDQVGKGSWPAFEQRLP